MKTKVVLICLVVLALLMPACRLLPVEETLPAVPVIRDYEKQEYKLTQVQRGDLTLSESVPCTYDIVGQENLAFSVGGVLIEKIHVTKGQTVKAGDLLASLDMENVQAKLDAQKNTIARLELQKDQLYEMRELALEKHDYILGDLDQQLQQVEQMIEDAQNPLPSEPTEPPADPAAQDAENEAPTEETQPSTEPTEEPASKPDITELLQRQQQLQAEKTQQESKRAATVSQYAEKLRNVEDSIYLQNLRLSEMEQSVQERQIVATIDGTITYVREYKEGDRSVKGKAMVTVCNWDSAYFVVKGRNNVGYFAADMEVSIKVSGKMHKAVVVDPEKHGIPVDPNVPSVYLQLAQQDPTITDGKSGAIQIILDQRQDVLYLDREAVITSNGKSFVYIQDEDGLRTIQEIKTGLEADDYVEITEGLQEGDWVIAE